MTDAGLEYVEVLTILTELNLDFAGAVTDDGLEHLKRWTSLQKLYLMRTQVTDAGLKHLHGMPS